MHAISLYLFAAQELASTLRQQKLGLSFLKKFSADFNEFSLNF